MKDLQKDILNFRPVDIYIGKPTLNKKENGINYWVQHLNAYPEEFNHFLRLKWPWKNQGYMTLEYIALKILNMHKLGSKEYLCRTHDLDWAAFANHGPSFMKSAPKNTFTKWTKRKPKLKVSIQDFIEEHNYRGFPDLIDFNENNKTFHCWEIKGPFDNLRSDQKEILKELHGSFKVESNILSFEFADAQDKHTLKAFRSQHRKDRQNYVNRFLESTIKAKIESYFRESCLDSVAQRMQYQPYLGDFEGWCNEDSKCKAYVTFSPKYFSSPYEILRIFCQNFPSTLNPKDAKKLRGEINLSQKEIIELTLYFYNLGYYKWWITPIIFLPLISCRKHSESIQQLLCLCVRFEQLFRTTKNSKKYSQIDDSYKKQSNDLEKHYISIMKYFLDSIIF